MAVFNEKQLKQHIKSKDFFKIYLIIGDESYLKKLYTSSIASSTVDSAFESFNLEQFDAKNYTLDDIFERAMLMPMMSEKRCIIVDDFKLDSIKGDELKKFEKNLEMLPESTVLIFKQETVGFSKTTGKGVFNAVDKFGAVCELNKRKGQDLYKPLISSAAKQDCVLSQSNAQYLVSCVGDDFNVLINELNKICAFVKSGEISKSAIDEVATKTTDAKVYFLTKALTSNNFDKAYEVLDSLLRQKVEPEYILGAIIGTYVDMYRVKVCSANAVTPSTLASVYNYKKREFTIDNAVRDSRNLELKQIRLCLDALYKADMKLKTGRDNSALVIEQVMVQLLLIANGEKV